jgi:hypothetical protein
MSTKDIAAHQLNMLQRINQRHCSTPTEDTAVYQRKILQHTN